MANTTFTLEFFTRRGPEPIAATNTSLAPQPPLPLALDGRVFASHT